MITAPLSHPQPIAGTQVAHSALGGMPLPIGHIERLTGEVIVTRADGARELLRIGDPLYQGDVLETGAGGAMGAVLDDETTFAMAENGQMALDEMVYDPGTQEGELAISVAKGVFTFVSGEISKATAEAMHIVTPVGTVEIRGTQVGLEIPDGFTLNVVLMEEADGFVGEVVVFNNFGSIVLNQPYQFTSVASFTLPPSPVMTMSPVDVVNTYDVTFEVLPTGGNANDYGAARVAGMEIGELAEIAPAASDEAEGGFGPVQVTETSEPLTAAEPPEDLFAFMEEVSGRGDEGEEAPPDTGGGGEDRVDPEPEPGPGPEPVMYGTEGDDVLSGGQGDDTIYGLGGNDELSGDKGKDTLYGGEGDDVLTGGEGEDTFIFGMDDDTDTVTDFELGDVLRFEGDGLTEDQVEFDQDGDDAIVSFSYADSDVEVVLNNTDSEQLGYTVTPDSDAVIVALDLPPDG